MENSKNNKAKSVIHKITSFFSVIAVIVGLIVLGVSFYYNDNLEKQINERDKIIENLTFSQKLVEDYFDIKVDSVKGTIYYTLKVDKGITRTINTTHTITETDTLLIDDYNGLVVKYNDLVALYNSISSQYIQTKDSLSMDEVIIGLIKKNYPIDITIHKEGKNQLISVKSSQIDSALILLPYFRDKLKINETGNKWIIEVSK
jgi:hypothetical protein